MGLNLGIMLAVSAGEQSLTPLAIRQIAEAYNNAHNGNTSLHWAAHTNCTTFRDLVAEMPMLVNHRNAKGPCGHGGGAPLHDAAYYGSAQVVKILLEPAPGIVRAKIEILDDVLRTPLHRAARQGQWECVQELLRAGADADAVYWQSDDE